MKRIVKRIPAQSCLRRLQECISMRKVRKIALMIAASAFAALPLLSQTAAPKPSFEVVSIKPSSPGLGIRGGGPRGDRFSMVGASLKMLVQIAYQPLGS